MGRAGYMGCLAVLGVVMLSVSCLAVFGATGAITAERGRGGAGAIAPPRPAPSQAEVVPPPEPRRTLGEIAAGSGTPGPAEPTVAPSVAPATRPALGRPTPPRTGTENSIVQRLEREAVGGGLKLKALGAAKTILGDRSVLAVYVRIENDGAQVIRVDPATFKLVDRAGNRYPVTRGADQMFPPVELRPRPAPGRPGELTEGNLTFEIPRTAQGLALLYELPSGGQPLRIPLPPEFG